MLAWIFGTDFSETPLKFQEKSQEEAGLVPAHLEHRAALKQGHRVTPLQLFPLPPLSTPSLSKMHFMNCCVSSPPQLFQPHPRAPHPPPHGPRTSSPARSSFPTAPRTLPRSPRTLLSARPAAPGRSRCSQHLSRLPGPSRTPLTAAAASARWEPRPRPQPRPLSALHQSAPRFPARPRPPSPFPPPSLGRASRQTVAAR